MSLENPDTLVELLENQRCIYVGDLRDYYPIIESAPNTMNPYHNFRHMLHVPWLCYEASTHYYRRGYLDPRRIRHLLIAAMFHDYGHSGQQGDDDLNIERAVRAFRKHVLPEDKLYQREIGKLIRLTQFPYTIASENLPLEGQILRDADMAQVFSTAWIQQVVFGLAEEWRMTRLQVLRMQEDFLSKLKFHTEWFQGRIPQVLIEAKKAEAKKLADILEGRHKKQ